MKMTKVDGHPDDADKPEQRVVFLDWATCDNVSQWSVKNGFSHCRVKNQSCHRIKCDLLKPISRKMQDQWKKELAQSDLPSKRKVPNTIRKYHIRRKWYFWMVFGTFLLLGKSDWTHFFSIGLVFFYWKVLIGQLIGKIDHSMIHWLEIHWESRVNFSVHKTHVQNFSNAYLGHIWALQGC